jgi:hypothetical protein
LLARGLVAGGVLTAGGILVGCLPKLAVSQPSAMQDAGVLEFLLGIEYLQAAFYTEVDRRGALSGELRRFARLVGEQERAHVAALERTWGGNPGKRPGFDFGDATANPHEFIPSAVELEEIAVVWSGWPPARCRRPDQPAKQAQVRTAMNDTGFVE